MKRNAEINFRITLDDDKMPSQIEWDATDASVDGAKLCEAILISLWDDNAKNTLGIDLWTKNMLVDDMNIFVYQTLKKIAETYTNASNDAATGNVITNCANEFAQRLNLLK